MTQEQRIELENLDLEYHRKQSELLQIGLKMTPLRILQAEEEMAKLNQN